MPPWPSPALKSFQQFLSGDSETERLLELRHQAEPLKQDHQNAYALGQGLQSIPGIQIDLDKVRTNILFFELEGTDLSGDTFVQRLEGKGVKILLLENGLYRAVTHRHISAGDVETTLHIVRELLG